MRVVKWWVSIKILKGIKMNEGLISGKGTTSNKSSAMASNVETGVLNKVRILSMNRESL